MSPQLLEAPTSTRWGRTVSLPRTTSSAQRPFDAQRRVGRREARSEPLGTEPVAQSGAPARAVASTSGHDAPGAPAPGGRWVYWRRRATVVFALLAVAFLLTGLIGRVGAEAELEDKVAGHVVVQPGETLWDVAAGTAPEGTDTREQLAAVRELNDIPGSDVESWTVVLIPAR